MYLKASFIFRGLGLRLTDLQCKFSEFKELERIGVKRFCLKTLLAFFGRLLPRQAGWVVGLEFRV